MKGQTEIKSAQYLKRWYSFRIFSCCVGQSCAWSQLTEIDSDSAKKRGLIPIPFPAEHCHAESIPTAIPVNSVA